MNPILVLLIIVFSILILNIIVYYLFSNFLIKRNDPGLRFLGFNLLKDLIWVAVILFFIDKTKVNFLFLSLIFLASSFILYYFVIIKLNKS